MDVTLEKLDDSGAEGATRSWVQAANLSGKRTELFSFRLLKSENDLFAEFAFGGTPLFLFNYRRKILEDNGRYFV